MSKQEVNVTTGEGLIDTGYGILDAGLFVAQGSLDVNVQETRSPLMVL